MDCITTMENGNKPVASTIRTVTWASPRRRRCWEARQDVWDDLISSSVALVGEHLSEVACWDEVGSYLSCTRLFDWAPHLPHARPLGKPDAHHSKYLVVSGVDGPRDRSETRPGGRSDPYAKSLRLTDAHGLRVPGCKNSSFAR